MKSNGKMAQLTATPRTEKKGAALRLLRQGGRVPAVVYGPEFEGASIHVDEKEMLKVARTGRSEMFNLNLEGGKTVPVLIKDQQERNGRLLHVDFLQISKNKPISVSVPIDFKVRLPVPKPVVCSRRRKPNWKSKDFQPTCRLPLRWMSAGWTLVIA